MTTKIIDYDLRPREPYPWADLRITPVWPDALSNLGWCLWSAGIMAAYERVAEYHGDAYAAPVERMQTRVNALNEAIRIIAPHLPVARRWRLDGPPEAIEAMQRHLELIGVMGAE